MNDFFSVMKSHTEGEAHIIELLSMRGFLFEKRADGWYMSDNAHIRDRYTLNVILAENSIGVVNSCGKVSIEHCENAERLRSLFEHENKIGFESESNVRSWQWFRRREHGYKVPTMDLEPYVAMYVKAISACGMETWFSCDGNNHGEYAIQIKFNGIPSRVWHRIMWEKILDAYFVIPWGKNYEYIPLNEDKYKRYLELNKAAMFLYEHRKQFREMKKNVMSNITPSKESHLSEKEIENLIEIRIDEYLKKNKI